MATGNKISELAKEITQKADEIMSLVSHRNESGKAGEMVIKKQRLSKSRKKIGAELERQIRNGFFDSLRVLGEIREELARRAVKVPITSLPVYVNKMVRNGTLDREKVLKGKKNLWAYRKQTSNEDKLS